MYLSAKRIGHMQSEIVNQICILTSYMEPCYLQYHMVLQQVMIDYG